MSYKKPHEPLFMGGFRSGTTLLANLLGFHPDLSPWFETKGLCELLRWQRTLAQPATTDFEASLVNPSHIRGFDKEAVADRVAADFKSTALKIGGLMASGKAHYESYPMGHDRILYSLEEALACLDGWRKGVGLTPSASEVAAWNGALIAQLGALHMAIDQKPLWINKTPEITRFGAECEDAIGPCKRIMMIRDGRDVIRSAVGLGWADPRVLADWWKGMIVGSRHSGSIATDRYIEVRYEALLLDPTAEVNRILKFLGVAEKGAEMIAAYGAFVDIAPKKRAGPSPEDDEILRHLDLVFLETLGYSV
jgi:hypothetical protein